MRFFAPGLLLVVLTACSTAPTLPTERLAALAHDAVPQPDAPQPIEAFVALEPTGFRFTLYRPEVSFDVERPDGRTSSKREPGPDQPLGVGFGSGLFLDASGNLSWLPGGFSLSEGSSLRVEGAFVRSRTIWTSAAVQTMSLERTKYSLVVTTPGLVGSQEEQIELGLPSLTALGWKVIRKPDGSAYQTPVSLLDFLLVPAVFDPIAGGVKVLTSAVPQQEVNYISDGDLLRSTDGRLRISRLSDHLQIRYLGEVFSLYRGSGRGCLIDEKNGRVFRWTEDPQGVVGDNGWAFRIRS